MTSKKLISLVFFVFVLELILTSAGSAADTDLVGWWKFDETSGTIARDASGNGDDGTIKGDPIWVVGKVEGSLEFDGDGDYVDVSSVGINGTDPRTIAGWVRASTTAIPSWTTVFGFAPDGDTAGTYFDIEVDDAGNYATHVGGGYSFPLIAVETQWHHFAVTHDGTIETFQGNQATTCFLVSGSPGSPYPDGLVPGTTYYWRIDEVEADGITKHKGNVWSFSIPPKTAFDPDPADGAEFVDPNTVTLTWTAGFEAKLHTVYLGEDYDEVNNATGGAPQGVATYSPGPLEREKVYYWRVDEFDGCATYKGNAWSFMTPGAVGNPLPVNGAADAGMNAILSWTPADSAASHQLYFGMDKETVRNDDIGAPEYKGSIALGAESYDPGLPEPDTTYSWRVDEVDGQGNVSTGCLWSFTTGTFLLVDDFEGYTDDEAAGKVIWQTWIDGFGIADNGAQVGYLMPPYAEQMIVNSGIQSMPIAYENTAGVTNSEATMTLTTPRDWTQAGVAELSLWLRGGSGNAAEPMYMAISNNAGAPAVVAYEDASAAQMSGWTEWVIPLKAFADQGINLINVDKIAIGMGSKSGMAVVGGTGTMYIDDIRLYLP